MSQIYLWKVILDQEWLAIILTFIILNLLVIIPPLFRKSKAILVLMILMVNLRFLLIFINLYIFRLPGSDKDAVRFVKNANDIANGYLKPDSFIGADLFESYLAFILKFISNNPIYLHLSSNIFFIMFLYIFILFLYDLNIKNRFVFISLIIINLFPSILMNTVTVLREPYQMFFLMLSLYTMHQYITKEKIINLFLFILSTFLLGISHNGLIIVIPLLIFIASITFLWVKRLTIKSFSLTILSTIIILSILILMKVGILTSQATDSVFSGEGLQYAEGYRLSSPDARASYAGTLDTSNIMTTFLSSMTLFVKYMIFPLPWMISSIVDLISIMENLIRIYLIAYILKNKIKSKIFISLFIIYIFIEMIWSLGTSNWGTASRHHIISMPILLIIFNYITSKSRRKS